MTDGVTRHENGQVMHDALTTLAVVFQFIQTFFHTRRDFRHTEYKLGIAFNHRQGVI